MELETFISNFASQFEETDEGLFLAQTNFKDDIEEWDSLIVLSIIARVDAEYGISISGEDIHNSQTIEDLFNLVKEKHDG